MGQIRRVVGRGSCGLGRRVRFIILAIGVAELFEGVAFDLDFPLIRIVLLFLFLLNLLFLLLYLDCAFLQHPSFSQSGSRLSVAVQALN